MKKIAVILSLALLFAVLAACAPADDATPPAGDTAAPPAGDTAAPPAGGDAAGEPLVIDWLSSAAESEAWVQGVKHVANEFAALNPGFRINFEAAPDQAARSQRLRILAAANELPDWMGTDSDAFMQGVAARGDIVNVGNLIEELDATDRFFDIAFSFNAFDDGSLYFWSFISVMEYWWYRPSHFEAAGISSADIHTFDDLLDAARTLQEAGFHPFGFCNSDWYVQRWVAFVPWRLAGNDFINELKFNRANMSSDIGYAAADWLVSMRPYLMPGWAANDFRGMVEAFHAGHTSIMYFGTWDPGEFVDLSTGNLKDDISMFMMPVLGDGRDVNLPTDGWANSGTGTAFSTRGMNDQHKEFLSFLIDVWPDTGVQFGFIPAVVPTEAQMANMPSAFQAILADLLYVQYFGSPWDINVDPATYTTLSRGIVELMLDQITTTEFVNMVDETIDEHAEAFWAAAMEDDD